MNYVDKGKEQLTDLIGKFVGSAGGSPTSRTVTIRKPREQVERFFRDPDKLSAVLGKVAQVRSVADNHEWRLSAGADETITWTTRLVEEPDGIRFVAADTGGDAEDAPDLRITYRDAPHDLGTEVTIRARTPFPDFLTGAALFKALYRARALLQTGEMPTLAHNPSGRAASSAKQEA